MLLAGLFPYAEFRKDLQPLAHSGEEVSGVQKMLGGDVFYGKDATEERFVQLAGGYRILHLATHGKANDEAADYSFLAFSEKKDSLENELLYVRDLYNLSLNADLVTLSACETGAGKLERGEGIISLARAFTYAGAKSIVTTLWSVQDERTKDLMLDFYRNLKKGMNKDEALRETKLAYLFKNNHAAAHPFFWAGVVAMGEMTPLFAEK
jgi:CHAT domain-containing protein